MKRTISDGFNKAHIEKTIVSLRAELEKERSESNKAAIQERIDFYSKLIGANPGEPFKIAEITKSEQVQSYSGLKGFFRKWSNPRRIIKHKYMVPALAVTAGGLLIANGVGLAELGASLEDQTLANSGILAAAGGGAVLGMGVNAAAFEALDDYQLQTFLNTQTALGLSASILLGVSAYLGLGGEFDSEMYQLIGASGLFSTISSAGKGVPAGMDATTRGATTLAAGGLITGAGVGTSNPLLIATGGVVMAWGISDMVDNVRQANQKIVNDYASKAYYQLAKLSDKRIANIVLKDGKWSNGSIPGSLIRRLNNTRNGLKTLVLEIEENQETLQKLLVKHQKYLESNDQLIQEIFKDKILEVKSFLGEKAHGLNALQIYELLKGPLVTLTSRDFRQLGFSSSDYVKYAAFKGHTVGMSQVVGDLIESKKLHQKYDAFLKEENPSKLIHAMMHDRIQSSLQTYLPALKNYENYINTSDPELRSAIEEQVFKQFGHAVLDSGKLSSGRQFVKNLYDQVKVLFNKPGNHFIDTLSPEFITEKVSQLCEAGNEGQLQVFEKALLPLDKAKGFNSRNLITERTVDVAKGMLVSIPGALYSIYNLGASAMSVDRKQAWYDAGVVRKQLGNAIANAVPTLPWNRKTEQLKPVAEEFKPAVEDLKPVADDVQCKEPAKEVKKEMSLSDKLFLTAILFS